MSTWVSQGILKGADSGVFGSVMVDFGSSDNGGADRMTASATVSAAWITSSIFPACYIVPGNDHTDTDDAISEELEVYVSNIVVGVSFDVVIVASNGTQGQWLVGWVAGGVIGPIPANSAIGVFIESPTSKTYVLELSAPAPFTITLFSIKTASGTCTAALNRNGSAITGLSAVSVTSTISNTVVSQAVSVGDLITLVLSSVSSAVDLSVAVRTSG
jgi:hypothetical protein